MINLSLLTAAAPDSDITKDIETAISNIENADPNAIIGRSKTIFWEFAPRVIGVLCLLIFAHLFIKAFVKFIKRVLVRSEIDPTLHNFILALVKNSMRVLAIIMGLSVLRVPTTPLITVIGSVGLALSLALKDSLANVAGGIAILFNHPFAKGDLIGVTLGINNIVGTVRAIDLFYTRIMTDDNKEVYLTNGDVARAIVTNYSSEPIKRFDLMFFIPVESEFEKAREIILAVLDSSAYTFKQPTPAVSISGRNEDSYMVSCKVWVKAEHYDSIGTSLHEGIDLKLKQAGM